MCADSHAVRCLAGKLKVTFSMYPLTGPHQTARKSGHMETLRLPLIMQIVWLWAQPARLKILRCNNVMI